MRIAVFKPFRNSSIAGAIQGYQPLKVITVTTLMLVTLLAAFPGQALDLVAFTGIT